MLLAACLYYHTHTHTHTHTLVLTITLPYLHLHLYISISYLHLFSFFYLIHREALVQLLASLQEALAVFLLPPSLWLPEMIGPSLLHDSGCTSAAGASSSAPSGPSPICGSVDAGGWTGVIQYKVHDLGVSHLSFADDGLSVEWVQPSSPWGRGAGEGKGVAEGGEEGDVGDGFDGAEPAVPMPAAFPTLQFTLQGTQVEFENIR